MTEENLDGADNTGADNGNQGGTDGANDAAAKAAADAGDTGGDTGDTGGDQGAPESYDLKLPENAILTTTESVAEFAKAQNYTQEQAQAALEYANSQVKEYHDGLLTQSQEKRAEWKTQAETDSEYGGEAFKANAELASRAVERFASSELKTILNESGYGNHPELVRMFVNIGKAMGEDNFESGNKGGTQNTDLASRIYPSQGTG